MTNPTDLALSDGDRNLMAAILMKEDEELSPERLKAQLRLFAASNCAASWNRCRGICRDAGSIPVACRICYRKSYGSSGC